MVVTTRTAQITPSETGMLISGTCTPDSCRACSTSFTPMKPRTIDSPYEVDQLLEQPADQEVQLTQTHQREGVGGEDDVRVLGQAEDRRDRVEREEHVGGADREHDDQHRRHQPLAVLDDEQLGAVVPVGGREAPLDTFSRRFSSNSSSSSSDAASWMSFQAVQIRKAPKM